MIASKSPEMVIRGHTFDIHRGDRVMALVNARFLDETLPPWTRHYEWQRLTIGHVLKAEGSVVHKPIEFDTADMAGEYAFFHMRGELRFTTMKPNITIDPFNPSLYARKLGPNGDWDAEGHPIRFTAEHPFEGRIVRRIVVPSIYR